MGHVAAVRCVQYDGHKVVSGAYDYTVKVWDPETESCTHTLQGHTNRVYSLQVRLSFHLGELELERTCGGYPAQPSRAAHLQRFFSYHCAV